MSRVDRAKLVTALEHPNVRAFLRLIREGESSQAERAYHTQVGGRILTSLADHPKEVVTVRIGGKDLRSSAAGAYQFLTKTWGECAQALDLANFGPGAQDLAAVFLIWRRRALDDVVAGRIEEAISKCNREWASLPDSPYGQPTQTMAGALRVYAAWGGTLGGSMPAPRVDLPSIPLAESPSSHVTPPLDGDSPQPTPPEAPEMPLATKFGWTLVSSLINAFSPLAREKITKEVGRHADRPEVAEQVADALIGAAKEATGMTDPLEAIVQARQNPAVMEQLETRAIEEIERLAPLLERMQAWEMQAHQATEDSRRAADERARASLQDQDPFLTRSIVWLMVAVLLGLAVLIGVLAGLGKDVQVLVGLLATLIGGVAAKFGTRFDHRYGTSASSAAKDALIDRVTLKAPPGAGRA